MAARATLASKPTDPGKGNDRSDRWSGSRRSLIVRQRRCPGPSRLGRKQLGPLGCGCLHHGLELVDGVFADYGRVSSSRC